VTRRSDYLLAHTEFASRLLKIVIMAEREGITKDTMAACFQRAIEGQQQLAEHCIVLNDLLLEEQEKTKREGGTDHGTV
jgi:hypothetical protein